MHLHGLLRTHMLDHIDELLKDPSLSEEDKKKHEIVRGRADDYDVTV